MFTVAVSGLVGCGSGSTMMPPAKPFEIDGNWTYLGPSDPPHDLMIDNGSMNYKDLDSAWTSKWTVKSYDNGQHHFQVAFDSGSGTYLPGREMTSGAYVLNNTTLTIQLASGSSYPQVKSPGTCTSSSDGTPDPECRLYIKAN